MLIFEPAPYRMFARRIKYMFFGFKRLQHPVEETLDACYKSDYLRVSGGHFQEFYCRDFGMCVDGLLALGHEEIVIRSLQYALSTFERNGSIATTINSRRRCVNFFDYGIDSLPFLLRSLRLALEHKNTKDDARALLETYKRFLVSQVHLFMQHLDTSGLIKRNAKLSTIKDHFNRPSSCYANCMAGMLSVELDKLGLPNRLKDFDYEQLLLKHFFTGSYFRDHIDTDVISGDANVFPFYCGIIKDKKLLKKCIKAIQQEQLDQPLPLKYTTNTPKHVSSNWLPRLFARNYETNTCWTHLGLCYVYLVAHVDKKIAQQYISVFNKLLKKYGSFLEVYQPNGKPFTSLFYVCDEQMSWIIMYAHIRKLLA